MAGGTPAASPNSGFGSLAPFGYPTLPYFSVDAAPFNAKGDGVTDDSTAIQRAINAAISIGGGRVAFTSGKTYVATGLVIRSNSARVVFDFTGATFTIPSATTLLTIYGGNHTVLGGWVQQANTNDQCKAIRILNDATTPIGLYNTVQNVHCYSVYQAFQVYMLALAGSGTNYRHAFYNCIAENFTLQKTWVGSFGFSFDGDTNGNAGGNDSKMFGCLVKGYEKNIIVRNSTRTTLYGTSIDGGASGIRYEAGGGLELIGAYIEYNDTIFELVSTPDGLTVLGVSFANYISLTSGALIAGRFINGFDVYGQVIGRIPIMGGDDNTGTGKTRFTGVNEVGWAIGAALDKIIRFVFDNPRYVFDLTGITGAIQFWLKKVDGKINFGDPSGNFLGWDIGAAVAYITSGDLRMNGGGTLGFFRRTSTPEGAVAADAGSICLMTAGGIGTVVYIKQSGAGNTGWVPVGAQAGALITTGVAMTNGAAAAAGTLTNAPAVGNPTKWIPINDNGTTRYIPAW